MKKVYVLQKEYDHEINFYESYKEFEEDYPKWNEPDEWMDYLNLPKELFMIRNKDGSYSGIDNMNGCAFTEDFETYLECINWLIDLDEDESVNLLTDIKEGDIYE